MLVLILFVVLVQGALAGRGILPFLVAPLLLAFSVHVNAGLPLTLTLAFVLILATGVLMDAGPVAFLAVPLVVSVGVAVILLRAVSPSRGRVLPRLPGDASRQGGVGPSWAGPWS